MLVTRSDYGGEFKSFGSRSVTPRGVLVVWVMALYSVLVRYQHVRGLCSETLVWY